MRVPFLNGVAAATLVFLVACTAAQQDELTRDAARAVIRPVLEENFPGIPLEPATDCIIDNATSGELLSLAADAVTGPTANTVEIVSDIVARPATLTCLAESGIPTLLGSF